MPIRFRPVVTAWWLALASGTAGLAHQVLWTRRLVDVLGANADTFSRVVGAFFVGLALGSWASSRATRSDSNFWRRVALAELAVALLAVPVLFSVEITGWLHGAIAPGRWMKLALPLMLVTPPAIAMGLVVPWMVQALSANSWFNATHSVWLYALNTLGGVLGIGLVVVEALPRFGLTGAGLCAIAVNLLVATGALALHLRSRRPRNETQYLFSLGGTGDSPVPVGDPPTGMTKSHPSRGKRLWAGGPPVSSGESPDGTGQWPVLPTHWNASRFLAFTSGFLVLALEVVLQHQVAQVTINSLFSSALVLVLVLLALAAAAAVVPWLVRQAGNERRALSLALWTAALLCAVQPFLFTGLRGGLKLLPYELPPFPYTAEILKLGLLAICPMLLAGGLVFPLLLRTAVAREGGCRVGLLFAWNGIGGWLGAELGQSWIAPACGLWGSVSLIAGMYGALFVWAVRNTGQGCPVNRQAGSLTHILVPALGVLAIGAGAWFSRGLPQAEVAPTERLVALAVGREGVVATIESGPGDWRMLFNNSYTLGGSKAQFNQERQGLLPLLLHGQPEFVATIGVATGGTLAGATLHPGVRRIDAIELSPLVLRYAHEFFGPYNRYVFHEPRVRFLQEDARWIIAGRRAAYDVVVGDLFLPWRTGEGRLFSREHFQNVRRSLKPGGLFCQWLPLFQLTRPQFDAIARTFREVFPDAFVVRGDFYSELPILGLVGGRELSQVNWRLIEPVCARLRAEGKVTDPLARHVEGVAMMVVGPLPNPPPGPVNTLANSWLEWDAGHNIVGLRTPWFIGVPFAEYVRDVHRAGQPSLPPEFRAAHDAGQFFLTLEIAARLKLPPLLEMQGQASARLPSALLSDAGADWRQWPMRVKPEFGHHSRDP